MKRVLSIVTLLSFVAGVSPVFAGCGSCGPASCDVPAVSAAPASVMEANKPAKVKKAKAKKASKKKAPASAETMAPATPVEPVTK